MAHKGPAPRPVSDRFWEKVDRGGSCWEWTAARYRNGYGAFGVAAGKVRPAHRVAWQLAHGPIGDASTFVLHRCDNRGCVNPDHLFLGTAAENTADMASKGRAGWQNNQPRWHKVDQRTANGILLLLAQGVSQEAVARHYGLGHTTISNVARGETAVARKALVS